MYLQEQYILLLRDVCMNCVVYSDEERLSASGSVANDSENCLLYSKTRSGFSQSVSKMCSLWSSNSRDTNQTRQVAQLSQRDRAAGWVSYGHKWKTVNGMTIFYGHYRSVFNHYDVIGQQSNRIRQENAK